MLYPNEVVIDDTYGMADAIPEGMSKGREARDYQSFPRGCYASAKLDVTYIPSSEWGKIIDEQERTKSRLSDIMINAGIESLDQNGTNFCWANGPTTAMQAVYARQGSPYVKLSAASVAAPIKNYRNQGGWGSEAFEYAATHGWMSEAFWPRNYLRDAKYMTAEGKANALLHRPVDWYDLPARDFDALMSMVLQLIPVAVGYNWWSHEVCAIDGVRIGNDFGIRIRNSWGMTYGSAGFAVLTRSKATPDDACGLWSATGAFV